MSNRPWMPLFIGDYRADTTHLSAVQHGAYLLLIMHYWSQGSLPDDDEQLARIACLPLPEWRKHRAVIRAFFAEGWRHKRIEREIAQATERYESRARAGRKGNEARWGPRDAIAKGSHSQPQSHPQGRSPSQGEDIGGLGSGGGTLASPGRPTLAVVNGGIASVPSWEDQP